MDQAVVFFGMCGNVDQSEASKPMRDFMKKLLTTLFSMDGRLSRKHFWLGYVLTMLGLNIAAWMLVAALVYGLQAVGSSGGFIVFTSFGIFSFVWIIVNLWATIAAPMKRFHDLNVSGWWVLWFWLMIYGGFILGRTLQQNTFGGDGLESGFGSLFVIGSVVAALVQFVWLGFFPGSVGSNKYGDDPIRPMGVDDVADLFK